MLSNQRLADRPLRNAKRLYKALEEIEQSRLLKAEEEKALAQDKGFIKEIIKNLEGAESEEDWENVWHGVRDMHMFFGGYVGDEIGKRLAQFVDELWHDVLDALVVIRRRS